VRCVTLMVNRSDRRFPNSVAKQGPRGRQTDRERSAEIHQGRGPHLMPDKQAGYMTATEFHIASALQPLHAGGVHICLAEQDEFETSVPIAQSLEALSDI
jgi:hypothetical protein